MSGGFNNPVIGGQEVLVRTAIKSSNYQAGVSGWRIGRDGSAEFNNVTIRASIVESGDMLFYNGTPAFGNLIASISGNGGNDEFGNSYPAGIDFFGAPGNKGIIAGNQLLANKTSAVALISSTNAAAADQAWSAKVGVEAVNRLVVLGSGQHNWSDGTNAADTNLYRQGADVLKTDDAFSATQLLANKTSAVALISSTNAAAADQAWSAKVGVEAVNRLVVLGSGQHNWSDGTNAADTNLYRAAADTLATDDDLSIKTAGKGLLVKEGANAKMGRAVLVGGTVVVNTTVVTANSEIFLTTQVPGGTVGTPYVSARTAGTSFTITSTSAVDTSTVAWHIVEPA